MTREEAIVITLRISRMGEKHYFQVPLPQDTVKIIGFEFGVLGHTGTRINNRVSPRFAMRYDPFHVLANKVIGSVTLWSASPENIFFQQDLIEDRNDRLNEGIPSLLWSPAPYIQGRKREEVSFSVEPAASFMEGFYEDSWGTGEYITLSYVLHLYLWIEKCAS